MKKILLVLILLFMLVACQSKASLDLDDCETLKLSYTMGGPMVIIEGEDLDKIVALLEDFEEIKTDDQDDDTSLEAINVLSDKDEGGLSIMVYPDSFATITDPENGSTRYIKFGDDTYDALAQYIDYDIDDLDLGS